MKEITNENISQLAGLFLIDYSKGLAQKGNSLTEDTISVANAVFSSELSPDEKVEALDKAIEKFPLLAPISEFLFDMLTIGILLGESDSNPSETLESPEWDEFEERNIDRGTELLNLLVYLRDCAENKVSPTLEDFLYEFLLVEEDDFQDEFFLYESVVQNSGLVESSPEEIITKGMKIAEGELAELFVPFFLFFHQLQKPEKGTDELILKLDPQPELSYALYRFLVNFNGE